MQMQGGFDATKIEPKQGGGTHPVGRFLGTISHTEIKENKDKKGGQFVVEITTPAGMIPIRYNMWNESQQAVEIANGQLSALCHATGRYQVGWQDEGAALRGAQLMIEVGFQKGHEPSTEKPAGGYTEVKKVLDAAGNEPGKGPAPSTQVQPNSNAAPMTSNGQGGWNNNPAPNPNQNPNPNPAPNPNAGGWQQGGGANPNPGNTGTPPWGQR